MKKIIKWGLIGCLTIVLVFIIVIELRKLYVKKAYEPDMIRLETIILQKDSENRGYSDIVKEKIEKEFSSDPLIKKAVIKIAILKRNLVRSNSMEEYNSRLKAYLFQRHCVTFLLFQANQDEKIINLTSVITDNQEMIDYGDFLDLFRFSTRDQEYDIGNWMNDEKNSVTTQSDFNEKCL